MATLEKEEYDSLCKKWNDMGIRDLALEFKRMQNEYSVAQAASAHIYAQFEILRKKILPEFMEEMGVDTIKVTDVGRVQIGQQVSAKQLDKEALMDWLREENHDALIADTVNASTLGSFIRAQIANGDPIPPDTVVEFKAYDVASVVKA